MTVVDLILMSKGITKNGDLSNIEHIDQHMMKIVQILLKQL